LAATRDLRSPHKALSSRVAPAVSRSPLWNKRSRARLTPSLLLPSKVWRKPPLLP
jgi:hypothetical protein